MCKICDIEGCDKEVFAKGLCSKHYSQIRRHGKILEQTSRSSNKIVVHEDFVEIYLNDIHSNIIGAAIIDLEDLQYIEGYKWHAKEERNGFIYARNNQVGPLHRYILSKYSQLEEGRVVDHIDHNTLNNRKSNLRICTNQQNVTNSRVPKNNKSGYKGVYWCSSRQKWQAQVTINNKTKYIGRYNNLEDAIEARKKAEDEYYGEFKYDLEKDSKYNLRDDT